MRWIEYVVMGGARGERVPGDQVRDKWSEEVGGGEVRVQEDLLTGSGMDRGSLERNVARVEWTGDQVDGRPLERNGAVVNWSTGSRRSLDWNGV